MRSGANAPSLLAAGRDRFQLGGRAVERPGELIDSLPVHRGLRRKMGREFRDLRYARAWPVTPEADAISR